MSISISMNDNKETTPLLNNNNLPTQVDLSTQVDLQTQIQQLQLQIQLQQLQQQQLQQQQLQQQQLQQSLVLNIPNNLAQNNKSNSECAWICCGISTLIIIVLVCLGVYFGITTSNGGN